MEYTLIKPITKVNGEKIETLELKEEFTGRDIKAILDAKKDGDGSIAIACVVCASSLSENTVLNMNSKDVIAISTLVAPFLGDGSV